MISLFSDEAYTDRWVESTFKGSDAGKFKWSAGKFYNDADLDKGKPVVIFLTFDASVQTLSRNRQTSSYPAVSCFIVFRLKLSGTIIFSPCK